MKSLFNEIHLEEMKARIDKLNTESVVRWGRFSVQRMVCHLLDNLGYALGLTEGLKEVAAGPPMFSEDSILHVQNLDILDGTPLLDIKPYVPEFDQHPAERIGWLAEA